MSFLYPLGLLGLIGIPILIIIYIIKSKYTEYTVASTYLWTLSEKFLKKRKPLDKVTGIISLILQILSITLISLALAHPIITLHGSATEYCFILDASGSMNMQEGEGKTRFDVAKDKISSVIDESVDGSVYSLIYVGDNTQVIFEKTDSKQQAKKLLYETSVSYGEEVYSDALGVAQGYFDENPGIKTYLVTDKSYLSNKNIELLSVGHATDNYTLSDVTYTFLGGRLTVVGNLTSYESDKELTVELYVNGDETPVTSGTVITKTATPTPFQLVCSLSSLSSLRVRITNEDAMPMDNEVCIYNTESEQSYKTLLVSNTPFFFESVLSSVTNAKVDVLSPKEYTSDKRGYGLYIFDGYEPEQIPRDGAVWLVNPMGSVAESGFSVQGQLELEGAQQLDLSSSSSTLATELTSDISGTGIYISKYIKCGLYRTFTTVLAYQSNPVLFAGTNGYGNREVVFAFDLHDSNLPLLMDFVVLIRNLVNYSFPEVIEDVSYYVGEKMAVNVITNCESIRVDSPSGDVAYLDMSGGVSEYMLSEVGTYSVTLMVSGSQRQFNVYSELPIAERAPSVLKDDISLQGEAKAGGLDGKYDPLMILLICLIVIFAADWMVYCYEKYQLR